MSDVVEMSVRVCPERDPDDEETAALTDRLRAELLETDVVAVSVVETGSPEGAKGLGTLIGWLSVRLGWKQARTVVSLVRDWAARNSRVVEVTFDGDVLKLHGATADQQEKIVNAWLERHAPRA